MAAANNDDFPWRQTGTLAICRLAEPIAFVSITSYAFVMVQDIHGEKDASFYAGLLVSAFAAAEACTAFIWGSLSDRYGRKPIIMVALAGTALSSLVFGFAKNYWLAFFARVIGGGLNGNVAVMQTMVAEMITKPEHEPRAYALQPVMWAVGSIAGSALGGFTAQPAKSYPGVFSEDGIFGEYPYLLPNLVAVAVILLAMLQGYLLLEETNPALIEKRKETKPASIPAFTIDERTPLYSRRRRESVLSTSTFRSSGVPYIAVSTPLPNDPAFDLRRPSVASLRSAAIFQKLKPTIETHDNAVTDDDEHGGALDSPGKTFNKSVVLWMVALWLLCYHQMAFGALFPIYLLDDPRHAAGHLDLVGGLGRTLPQVGTILAANSVISLVIQGGIFPIYVHYLGVWWSTVSLVVLCPLALMVAPFVSLLSHPMVGVYVVMIVQQFTSSMAYPVMLILLKNACPSTLVLGKVNGVAMSGASGARTIAPPLVGALYSGIGSAAAWWSAGIVAIIGVIELCFISRPKDSSEEVLRKASMANDLVQYDDDD